MANTSPISKVIDFMASDRKQISFYVAKSDCQKLYAFLSKYKKNVTYGYYKGKFNVKKFEGQKPIPRKGLVATAKVRQTYKFIGKAEQRFKYLRQLIRLEMKENNTKKKDLYRKAITSLGLCTKSISHQNHLRGVLTGGMVNILAKTKDDVSGEKPKKLFVEAASAFIVAIYNNDNNEMTSRDAINAANQLCEEDIVSPKSFARKSLVQLSWPSYGKLLKERFATNELLYSLSEAGKEAAKRILSFRDSKPKIRKEMYSHNNESGIVLRVDEREGGQGKKLYEIHAKLKKVNVSHETHLLPIGDYDIVYKDSIDDVYKLPFVIERKTFKDIQASLIDGRYEKQKARLISYKQKNPLVQIFFLFEGNPEFNSIRFLHSDIIEARKKYKQLCADISSNKNFKLLTTNNPQETSNVLRSLWKKNKEV
mmetsp:Transcript_18268/g.20310  ORF Transcript_18268/g.20310 Transcript_18268/m.20310 type:complete len:424 (-) Transcript_18268:449-1720(-)